ncbi:MAG: MotA/TolQ/ExbB proton channel family protein [Candidatus Omnitrophica bacterium]|nr:MotA/TolQ/ExbB proton channel family protein [Candidatus Omnitrophota bacterium]
MFKNFTIWEAMKIGGVVVYFLLLCSIVSITIILERLLYYYVRSRVPRATFMKAIREQFEKNDLKAAMALTKDTAVPYVSVVKTGLNSFHHDEKEINDAMEREIIIQINDLERWTAIVGTIGSTAVYIGLLGTVWGIIRTFRDIYQFGSGGINVVVHGISEALVCTAAGLLVAIPAVMAYNYFIKRVKGFVMDMELAASEVSSLINIKKKSSSK